MIGFAMPKVSQVVERNQRAHGSRLGLKFPAGRLVATRGALERLAQHAPEGKGAGQLGADLLNRHLRGDWGTGSATLNNEALEDGGKLLSAYDLAPGARIWIITEGDRSATTILTPEEY